MTSRARASGVRRPGAAAGPWRCPRCGRRLGARNGPHLCGTARELSAHFDGKPAILRLLFGHLLEEIRACGPVTVLPERTRIAFRGRLRFLDISVQPTAIRGRLVLRMRGRHARFIQIDSLPSGIHVHHFRLTTPDEIDPPFIEAIRDAYAGTRRKPGRSA